MLEQIELWGNSGNNFRPFFGNSVAKLTSAPMCVFRNTGIKIVFVFMTSTC